MGKAERIAFGRELLSDLLELRHCTIGQLAAANGMTPNEILELMNEALACEKEI